jgi:hypothetical protein
MEINHSNPGIIITDGETLYDKALYIVSDPDLEKSDNISFSKPMLHEKRIMIMTNNADSSYFAIGVKERGQLAAWLLDGLEEVKE